MTKAFVKSNYAKVRLVWPLFSAIALITCQREGKRHSDVVYPAPLPDSTSLVFLPGLVSTDSFDFNSAFTTDGRSYYFSRRTSKRSDIFVVNLKDAVWSTPLAVTFNTSAYSEADPAFDNEGRIYFISNRPRDSYDTLLDYDIWYALPKPNGGWEAPELLNIVNSDSSEFYISFSRDGSLYFASSRAGGFGEEDIYVSRRVNGKYSVPENLGPTINSTKSEYDPGISPDEKYIVFTSSNRHGTFGGGDLYGAMKNSGNEWSRVVHLDGHVNTVSREFCSFFSPDSKFFFYSSDGDVKWTPVNLIKRQIELKANALNNDD
jgi:Tol biopolymer transport system component